MRHIEFKNGEGQKKKKIEKKIVTSHHDSNLTEMNGVEKR